MNGILAHSSDVLNTLLCFLRIAAARLRFPRVMPSLMLAGLLLLGASSEAQPALRQVLVLQSFDRGVQVLDYLTGNLHVDLDERLGRPVNVVQVVVTPSGAVGA